MSTFFFPRQWLSNKSHHKYSHFFILTWYEKKRIILACSCSPSIHFYIIVIKLRIIWHSPTHLQRSFFFFLKRKASLACLVGFNLLLMAGNWLFAIVSAWQFACQRFDFTDTFWQRLRIAQPQTKILDELCMPRARRPPHTDPGELKNMRNSITSEFILVVRYNLT